MAKTWDKMTDSEKIEDLRKDVKTIFGHLNEIRDAQNDLASRLNGAVSLLSEVADAVKKLEKR
jgi:uncharacterized protein YoxC